MAEAASNTLKAPRVNVRFGSEAAISINGHAASLSHVRCRPDADIEQHLGTAAPRSGVGLYVLLEVSASS